MKRMCMRYNRSTKLRWGPHLILLKKKFTWSLLDVGSVNKWTCVSFVGRYDMDKILHEHYDWFVVKKKKKNDVMCIDFLAFDSHF